MRIFRRYADTRIADVISRAVGIAVLAVVGLSLVHVAGAVEWAEPTAIPPSANPPGFVWTRSPSNPAQPGGQFHVAGAGKLGGLLEALSGAVFGSATLDLGTLSEGQNVMFGSAKYSAAHPTGDALLLLQTASDATPPVMTDRLRIDRDGNVTAPGRVAGAQLCIGAGAGADCKTSWPSGTITGVTAGSNLTGGGSSGNVTIGLSPTPTFGALSVAKIGDPLSSGNLTVAGCLGPVLVGRTTPGFQGNIGGSPGYVSANAKCNDAITGSHVCTTAEILNSINCGAIANAGVANETDMWIANLAPSLPTPTNDCVGWTNASSDWWGIKWRLNTTTGGGAFAERCSTSLPFACCR